CVLQHEFGIFGGESGVYILSLIHRLEIPLAVTFHTILEKPSYNEKAIIKEIGSKAAKIMVMSNRAVKFLKAIYKVPAEKIEVIHHGVPDFNFKQSKNSKKKFNIENKKTLFTFGLLSRNKGIETVINALPKVVKKHPDLIYIVLGKTHPGVLRVSGEEYRNYLIRLVEKNDLKEHVYFDDRFVSNDELYKYLVAIDVYITPYLNKAQITSGTLSYAVGAGAAVISTPYWHAEELLADGHGLLFKFGNSDVLSNILLKLFETPNELIKLRKKAYNFGRKTIWPIIGQQYLKFLSTCVKTKTKIEIKKQLIIDPMVLPNFCLSHIKRLTDDTGIIQHAKYSVPNWKEGYCLDDNARALLMTLMAYRQKKDTTAFDLIPIYLSYIHYLQNDNGTFRNFLSFNRQFLDEEGSEDSFGRTVWALGYLIRFSPNEAYFQLGRDLFAKAKQNFLKLKSLRGISNTMIGIGHYLNRFQSDEELNNIIKLLANKLHEKYKKEQKDDWHWFEPMLTYDNGIMPLALFHAYEATGDKKILKVAQKTMEFLEKKTFNDGYLSLIGSDDWHQRDNIRSQYAQQPIDAMSMVMMYFKSYTVLQDKKYIDKMYLSFKWFIGENDLRIPLYDFETCGCNDGLESYGVNRNQGAESMLAYLIAHLTVLLADEVIL
ncbi:glycosyltransferase, partial [bacterium]|nr:glycosyltransferase [bacterium]